MKEQGSALRIVAFAVALAVVLGLASVMFQVTASAEDATSVSSDNIPTSVTGTFGNYSAVKFTASNQIFDPSTVFTDYDKKSYIGVFAYEKDGKLVIYDDLYSYLNNGVIFFEFANGSFSGIDDSLFYILKTDKYKDSVSEQAAYFNNYVMLYHSKSDFNYSDLSQNLPLNMFPSRIITFDGFTDLYMIYTTATGILSKSDCKSKIADMTADVNKMSISQWQSSDSSSPSAEFVSCKSAPTGYPEGVLWFEDWIKEGMQYPYFSWYIRDNGNHHSYSVKFSYNSSQVDTCEKVFNNRFYDELENVKQNPLLLFAESGIIFAASKLKWLAEQVGLLKNITAIQWKNLSYTDSFVLKSVDMDFTACENSGNKVFSVCLSDYSDIGRYFIYRADIIDNVTGQVLDTTFFCPLNKFNKGNSGYGSKIYDYGDNGDGMLDDLINNSPSVDPSIKNPFDISGDVIDNNYGGGSLSDLDISDIASSLESSVNSVSVFFRFCWTLFPSAIWSIILLGLSLIIILRVLGR